MFKNIRRNPARIRKSPRGRTSPLESMTPQGQALWSAENVENAYNYVSDKDRELMRLGYEENL